MIPNKKRVKTIKALIDELCQEISAPIVIALAASNLDWTIYVEDSDDGIVHGMIVGESEFVKKHRRVRNDKRPTR